MTTATNENHQKLENLVTTNLTLFYIFDLVKPRTGRQVLDSNYTVKNLAADYFSYWCDQLLPKSVLYTI